MADFPFSPNGVQDKLTALYALSNSELQIQANLIKTDFRLWMNNVFILNSDQQNYLEDLSDTAVDYFARQCSICFINRLPINVQFPGSPDPDTKKWITTEDSIISSSDGTGHTIISGSFAFSIFYK